MNPRRVIATKYSPPMGEQAATAARKPARNALEPPTPKGPTDEESTHSEPDRPAPRQPRIDRRIPVSTRLEPEELDKLDRLGRKAGGLVGATRSATLRWLVQSYEE